MANSRRLILTLAAGFGAQILLGVLVVLNEHSQGLLGGLAGVLVASLVLGIGRTWEIIGVRDPGIRASLHVLKRRRP